MNFELRGCAFSQANRFQQIVGYIGNVPASHTNHMVMRVHIGFEPGWTVVQTHLRHQPMLDKRSNVFVHRRQRDGRDLLPDLLVHGFRTGMAVQLGQDVPDHLTLVCHRESLVGAQLSKGLLRHNNIYYSIITIEVSSPGETKIPLGRQRLADTSTMNTRPQGCLLVLDSQNSPAEHEAHLLRANPACVELRCAAEVRPKTTVQLKLRDGVVLGRISCAGRGLVTITVDHVSATLSELGNLAKALSNPVCSAAESGAMPEEAVQMVLRRRIARQ